MANYNNIVIYEHTANESICRALEAYKHDKLFAEFIPVPSELKIEAQYPLSEKQKRNLEVHGYTDWYDFCVHEWGTKWDVGASSDNGQIIAIESNKMILRFNTVDSPPINYYYFLVENFDYNITAYYCGEDKSSYGIYTRKNGHKHFTAEDKKIVVMPILKELFDL